MIKALLLIKTEDMSMATVRTFIVAELDTDTGVLSGRIDREVEIPIDVEMTGKKDQALKAVKTIGTIKPMVIDCWTWLDGMATANKAGELIEILITEEAFDG